MSPYLQLPRFVHLGFNARGRYEPGVNKQIEGYLDSVARDWYRYGRQNYVVWTNRDLASLSKELTQLPGLALYFVLTTEFSRTQINGMMAPQFWEWFNKPR